MIYDHRVITADGDVLAERTPAERTVTLKRMALSALEGLSSCTAALQSDETAKDAATACPVADWYAPHTTHEQP